MSIAGCSKCIKIKAKARCFCQTIKNVENGEIMILWKPGRVAWFRCEIAATAALMCASMVSDILIGTKI